jgi:hypothetical protein
MRNGLVRPGLSDRSCKTELIRPGAKGGDAALRVDLRIAAPKRAPTEVGPDGRCRRAPANALGRS